MYMLSFILSLLLTAPGPQSVTVTVKTTGLAKGTLHLAVYANAQDFAKDHSLTGAKQAFQATESNVELDLPGAGTYVIAAFQDLNGNGKLDTNLFGVPTEPYGFSKTPPSKWRAPAFDEVATEVGEGFGQPVVELRTWGEY